MFIIRDLDAGAECTITKFSGDTKLGGAVDSSKGQELLQRNPDRLVALGNQQWHAIEQEQMLLHQ